ncbi:MAG: histidine kinase [Bacteroidota bacterium]
MIQKIKHCAAVLLLLWLPQKLLAQKDNPLVRLKAGQWLEMRVINLRTADMSSIYTYELRYALKKIQADGIRDFQVTVQRTGITSLYPRGSHVGYDSYYPPYLQNRPSVNKPAFQCSIDKNWKVKKLRSMTEIAEVPLYEMLPRKKTGGVSLEVMPVDTGAVLQITESLIAGRRDNAVIQVRLIAASFPLPDNMVIRGKLTNLTANSKPTLNINYGSGEKVLQFKPDGSFSSSFVMDKHDPIRLTYSDGMNSHSIRTYADFGDTLILQADALDFVGTAQFTGDQAADANLGIKLFALNEQYKTEAEAIAFDERGAANLMELQKKQHAEFVTLAKPVYNDFSYHKMKHLVGQAQAKLDYLFKARWLSSPNAEAAFRDFPKDFFLSIDTLPIFMNWNKASWFTNYLHSYKMYQSERVSMVNNSRVGFLSDFALSLTYLKAFPLYHSLAEAFEDDLSNSTWKEAQKLAPYYDDFIRNCGDKELNDQVTEKWKLINAWTPGSNSPLSSLKLADGSVLDLKKFKGKTLSITFNFHYPEKIEHLLDRIKKTDPKKVHFVIVQLKEQNYPKSSIDSIFKSLPNVTYVQVLPYDEELEKKAIIDHFDIKTFILDPDFKVIDDNIDETNTPEASRKFKEALKKASEPKKVGKADKAQLIKTIGWSAGSILFTFLVLMLVNKRRITSIRKKEALKRQIKELEIKAIRSQMNPHFLFNALNSIQSLINNQQYKQANIYLEKFSFLMRKVLNNSGKSFVPLSDELQAVELYCELERLRFNFDFSIEVSEETNTQLIEIPGMIIQPLVENAVVHGLSERGSAGKLSINIHQDQSYLHIEIRDNGRGLSPASENPQGFGLKLVRERLALLNAGGADGKLTLRPNLANEETGTTAVLIIPID